MSLISARRCSPLSRMSERNSRWRGDRSPKFGSVISSENPMTEFSGVRSSWRDVGEELALRLRCFGQRAVGVREHAVRRLEPLEARTPARACARRPSARAPRSGPRPRARAARAPGSPRGAPCRTRAAASTAGSPAPAPRGPTLWSAAIIAGGQREPGEVRRPRSTGTISRQTSSTERALLEGDRERDEAGVDQEVRRRRGCRGARRTSRASRRPGPPVARNAHAAAAAASDDRAQG